MFPSPTLNTTLNTFLSAQREAAAVSFGVDVSTFNMLMDMQHRDITPEDYDTLRRTHAAPLRTICHGATPRIRPFVPLPRAWSAQPLALAPMRRPRLA